MHADLRYLRSVLRSAVVSDALDAAGCRSQCLPAGMAPLDPTHVLVGRAFTVITERVEGPPEAPYVGLLKALDAIDADDVYVISDGGREDVALWGELISTACKARGVAGAVCDGYVRDSERVKALDFPCFSHGTIPSDINGRLEVVAHGVPLRIGDTVIDPGDLVVGDVDGVVVVPEAIRNEVVAHAIDKATREHGFRAAVADGMLPSEAFEQFQVL